MLTDLQPCPFPLAVVGVQQVVYHLAVVGGERRGASCSRERSPGKLMPSDSHSPNPRNILIPKSVFTGDLFYSPFFPRSTNNVLVNIVLSRTNFGSKKLSSVYLSSCLVVDLEVGASHQKHLVAVSFSLARNPGRGNGGAGTESNRMSPGYLVSCASWVYRSDKAGQSSERKLHLQWHRISATADNRQRPRRYHS